MSAIYSKLNKVSIEKAIAKAKAVKPLVKVLGFNEFQVKGSKGELYAVSFTGKGLDFTGLCECRANTGNKVCYHVAAVAPIYKRQVAEKAATPTLLERIETGRAHIAAIRATLATTQATTPVSRESICRKCFNQVVKNGLCQDCNADLAESELFG